MSSIVLEIDWQNHAAELSKNVEMALVRAINRVADRSRTEAARRAKSQINFPASYLNPSQGRLRVAKRAKRLELEAIVEGRDRATSLARFTKQKPDPRNRAGVKVRVAAEGSEKTIKRGFLMNLKNGNTGLAVRTSGGPPEGAWRPKKIAENLYLLYGPSVDQAMMAASRANGVYEEIEPDMLDLLNSEFLRQLDLLEGAANG